MRRIQDSGQQDRQGGRGSSSCGNQQRKGAFVGVASNVGCPLGLLLDECYHQSKHFTELASNFLVSFLRHLIHYYSCVGLHFAAWKRQFYHYHPGS